MTQQGEGNGARDGGIKDDLEGGTTGATSQTDGDWSVANTGGSRNEAAPGGRRGGASEDDLGPIGMESATPGPQGASGEGDIQRGPAANGTFGTGTYDTRGDVTGPDSPAGADFDPQASGGEGQGDDLANRLGGGGTRSGVTGAGAATGAMDAGRSERTDASAQNATGAGGPDAGSPGGMGGVHAKSGATGTGRPPGGVSPMQMDQQQDEDRKD